MAELTALAGLSHSRVHDLFKAELGLSPRQVAVEDKNEPSVTLFLGRLQIIAKINGSYQGVSRKYPQNG